MNNFKIKKISHKPPRKPLSEKTKQNILTAVGIILLVVFIYYSGMQLIDRLSGTKLIQFFSGLFGTELSVDDKGHTNILIAGVGGEGHEGKDLTDTLMIASVDNTSKTVSMISVPRDLYVESTMGGMRINRLYEQAKIKWNDPDEALDLLKKTLENILAVEIPYSIKIDFEAFEKIIDELGGVEINVEQDIADPDYPDANYGYDPFYLSQGLQHLDGKTALKYVRSRKSSSDFDRSKRQQQLLVAIKEKVTDKSILTRKSFLKKMYYSLTDHIETNMSISEMLSLAEFAIEWDSKNLSVATLNDEPIFRGGFLYTPLRELYGGAFVLLPAGDNFNSIRQFTELVFYEPKNLNDLPIIILNGTTQNGLAARVKSIFHRFGINILEVGNSQIQNLRETTIYASQDAKSLADFIGKLIPAIIITQEMPEAKLLIELGEDSIPFIEKLDIFKNVVQLVPAPGTPTQ